MPDFGSHFRTRFALLWWTVTSCDAYAKSWLLPYLVCKQQSRTLLACHFRKRICITTQWLQELLPAGLELIFLGKTRATLHNKITRNYYMLDWLWLFGQESTNFTWRTGFITLWNKTITELLCRTRIAFFRNRRFALQDRTITRWLYAGLLGFSLQDNLKTRTNKRGRWLLYSDFDYSLWK